MAQEIKVCQNCKSEFVIEPEDFLFYEKIKVPPPTWCPECRLKRRMVWRNERALYKRRDSFSGKNIISIYSPDAPYKIIDQKSWWSDDWDPMEYGMEVDFNIRFLSQFSELLKAVPRVSLQNVYAVNCDYCNVASKNKNSYLISAAHGNENVLYANRVLFSKDSADLYFVDGLELSYDDSNCKKSYRLAFSQDSENCRHSFFLFNCKNCENCFGCVNLRNKSYHIFNIPYSKEEYEEKMKEFDSGSYRCLRNFIEKFDGLKLKYPHRFAEIINSTNVSGDNIRDAKNCFSCFKVMGNVEDCKFIEWGGYGMKDSYDMQGGGDKASLLYEVINTERTSRIYFSTVIYDSFDVYYSADCFNSQNLFGCIGLRNKSYCILNKQYTKEEYEALAPKIIDHMNSMPYVDKKGRIYKYGEFFPPELSPFAYNETIAQEYFPLTIEQAKEQGYHWKEPESRSYEITIAASQLPDHIKDISDSILNEIIECANNSGARKGRSPEQETAGCTTAFKIIPQELQFYRKMNLPLPRFCPNCRHYQRIKQRNPLKLWRRKCQCGGGKSENGVYLNQTSHFHGSNHCPNEFETSYSPTRPEIVYCEQRYQSEIY